MMSNTLLLFALSSVSLTIAQNIKCLTSQPRSSSDPSGQQISDALTSNSQLQNICSGKFPPLASGGFANTGVWNHGEIFINVTRASSTTSLSNCLTELPLIISSCITGENYWGGSYQDSNTYYSIKNNIWPNNPLLPQDAGGPGIIQTGTSFVSSSTASQTTATAGGGNGNGPVTVPPQTAIESGTFSTTTTSIVGLTANSVTTTTDSSGPTILPIWYVGPGVGVIVIPITVIGPPGIVPPPPGLPTLSIDSNGDVQTASSTKKTTTSSTSTSSTIPVSFPFPIPTINTAVLQVLAQKILASELSSTTSSAPASPATQSAVPIKSPACNSVSVPAYPTTLSTSTGDVDINDLMYLLRQNICAGPCSAPSGVPVSDTAIATDDVQSYCEISVGISAGVEAYMFRNSPAVDVEWQECWDSTAAIINNCVDSKNHNVGWWNGDHVYQFYQGGLRPLNDKSAKHTASITAWLPVPTQDTSGYTCYTDCRNNVPDEAWCMANCPCFANEPHVC